jgi:Beta-ketoacyl synthase, N-terminal domain
MTRVFIDGIGVFGTGFANWQQTREVLRGDAAYTATDLPLPSPEWLPAAERRRTSDIIRLALCAGREALEDAGQAIDDTYTVFSSSGGSGEVIHQICESLATAEREVSPTRFHNSVHNAPAGYWGIATRSEWPSTSLCAHDASFAAAVIESVAQAMSTDKPVLLLAHDLRYPEPLNGVRPVMGTFSVAMLMRKAIAPTSKFELDVSIASRDTEVTKHADQALEAFRMRNPAAHSLPLLAALAREHAAVVIIENNNGGRLQLAVRPLAGTAA